MAQPPRKKAPGPVPDTENAPGQPTVADILAGKASGVAGAEKGPANPLDELHEFKDMLSEQRERQGRLRHVQQFLTSPLFIEMRDQPVTVSEDRAAIEERKRDLDYRIRVLESLVSILIEERDFLDRAVSEDEADTTDREATKARAG